VPSLEITELTAFADHPDRGNPAAVAPLDAWLPDATLQEAARRIGLSETAFLVPTGDRPEGAGPDDRAWHLRWFTPAVEVDLCGHATLASAAIALGQLVPDAPAAHFTTRSGWLTVRRSGEQLSMDLPSRPAKRVLREEWPPGLAGALGLAPERIVAVWKARDLLVVVDTEDEVLAVRPDLEPLRAVDDNAVIVTGPAGASAADGVDFVSRFFAPNLGIDEDPVTGSAHCTLVPYWAARANRRVLHGRQVSARTGDLWCRLDGDRVVLTGSVTALRTGTLDLPDRPDGT